MMSQEEIAVYYQENIRLIHSVAQQYAKSGYEYEELFSEATLGFVKGLQAYDPAKGVKISTYLYKCMRNEINQRIRKDNAKSRTAVVVSYDAEVVGKDGRSMSGIENMDLSQIDRIHSFTDDVDSVLEAEDIMVAAKRIAETYLTENERKAFLLRMKGRTQNEIAKMLNLSQANISKTLKMARCKLALHLSQEGYISPLHM